MSRCAVAPCITKARVGPDRGRQRALLHSVGMTGTGAWVVAAVARTLLLRDAHRLDRLSVQAFNDSSIHEHAHVSPRLFVAPAVRPHTRPL